MTPCSTSISPSIRPLAFCSSSARLSCSCERMPSCTSASPIFSFREGALTVFASQEAPHGGVGVLEVIELRRQVRQLEHFADCLVCSAQAQHLPALAHLFRDVHQGLEP